LNNLSSFASPQNNTSTRNRRLHTKSTSAYSTTTTQQLFHRKPKETRKNPKIKMNHDMSGMSGMDSSSSSSSINNSAIAMSIMETTFHTKISTPLYTTAFTPQTAGQYTGAILFLIILGIIFRLLAAVKVQTEHRWREEQAVRKVVISKSSDLDNDNNSNGINGTEGSNRAATTTATAISEKGMGTATTITGNSTLSSSGASTSSETAVNDVGVNGNGTGLNMTRKERRKAGVAPWRWRVDMVRGFLQLCIALVGYLL